MKKALIITGGYVNYGNVAISTNDYEIIIAADSGYISAKKLGIKPTVILGDFDSSPLPDCNVEIIKFPTEKDDTDTMLACKLAISQGYNQILIVGGTGGRADHYFANVFSLIAFKEQKINVSLTDGDNTVSILDTETVTLPYSSNYFSLIPIGNCYATLSGCKYPLDNFLLPCENPSFAISNEITEDFAKISVNGKAILCECKK